MKSEEVRGCETVITGLRGEGRPAPHVQGAASPSRGNTGAPAGRFGRDEDTSVI